MEGILAKLLEVTNQLQVSHWNTYKHIEHQYIDIALEQIAPKVDEFVEVFQGKFVKRLSPKGVLTVEIKQDFAVDELIVKVDDIKAFLKRKEDFDNDELCDIIDDIKKSLYTLKHHLTLS